MRSGGSAPIDAAMKRRSALLCLLAATPLLAFGAPQENRETKEQAQEQQADAPKVRLKTSLGEILIQLDPEKAPITTKNFLRYVESGHYQGTVFHRVIKDFMIQGGGFGETDGKLVERATEGAGIKNESQNGLLNQRGTIAMARTSDPNSARAQFFINTSDNRALDFPNNGGYAVFGKVIEGMDVVEKINKVATKNRPIVMRMPGGEQTLETPADDVPSKTVTIISASKE